MKSLVLSTVAAAMLVAMPAAAATYSAYDQFNISGGVITAPNFAFGYGPSTYAGADTFSSFDTIQALCAGDNALQCAHSRGLPGVFKTAGAYISGTSFFEPGELNLHPGYGNEAVVVQFIAPIAGMYTFSGAFSANDAYPNTVDVGAYLGGVNQISNSLGAFNFGATLTAGQKVNFAVGGAGYINYDSTGLALNVTGPDPVRGGAVPEPASWALMIIGFGGAGAALRRRRLALG